MATKTTSRGRKPAALNPMQSAMFAAASAAAPDTVAASAAVPAPGAGVSPTPAPPDYERFSFVCSSSLVGKVKALSRQNGWSIRQVMERFVSAGLESYESKRGPISVSAAADIADIL